MTTVPKLKVVRITKFAQLPTKATAQSAGYDLYSAYRYVIPPYGKQLLDTDLRIAVPEGSYGRIAPTSKLSWKHHIDVGGMCLYI